MSSMSYASILFFFLVLSMSYMGISPFFFPFRVICVSFTLIFLWSSSFFCVLHVTMPL